MIRAKDCSELKITNSFISKVRSQGKMIDINFPTPSKKYAINPIAAIIAKTATII